MLPAFTETSALMFGSPARSSVPQASASAKMIFMSRSYATDTLHTQLSVRHYDSVDDMNHAIGLEDVGLGNRGHAALFVMKHDLAAVRDGPEFASVHRLELGLATLRLS